MRRTRPAVDRFNDKVQKGDGCWQWMGGVTSSGYGGFWSNSAYVSVHRFSYELVHGPIPEGLVIDHLCRNKLCVNPAHLEAVTHRENTLRGISQAAANVHKTHCLRGHEFSTENTYIDARGHRSCLTCRRFAHQRGNTKKRAMKENTDG